ncbi:hypothetical protein EYF80_008613 [Liparis tanakae]|uniref:Uncharacterized protein n=1 Tax=Liparis tanakae TaxID=230148 RepID=A0A4Z2IT64_9TELE|nr:hypothetical protein EYF80_008613 [Liparis tanakae]
MVQRVGSAGADVAFDERVVAVVPSGELARGVVLSRRGTSHEETGGEGEQSPEGNHRAAGLRDKQCVWFRAMSCFFSLSFSGSFILKHEKGTVIPTESVGRFNACNPVALRSKAPHHDPTSKVSPVAPPPLAMEVPMVTGGSQGF